MPTYDFFTQPSGIVGQILNFGLPSPTDVQVVGPPKNDELDDEAASKRLERMRKIRGAVDVHLQQVVILIFSSMWIEPAPTNLPSKM